MPPTRKKDWVLLAGPRADCFRDQGPDNQSQCNKVSIRIIPPAILSLPCGNEITKKHTGKGSMGKQRFAARSQDKQTQESQAEENFFLEQWHHREQVVMHGTAHFFHIGTGNLFCLSLEASLHTRAWPGAKRNMTLSPG